MDETKERALFDAWYKDNYSVNFDLWNENNPAMLFHMSGLIRAWMARAEIAVDSSK